MPIILPDTSQAEDMDPSVAGTYHARIVKCGAQQSKEKKVNQAVPEFKMEGVPREDNQEVRTITRLAWLNIEGKGAMGWDQLLRAAGFAEIADRYRAGEKVPFNTDDLEGKELNVVLKVGEYNGRRRDEVAGFLPL